MSVSGLARTLENDYSVKLVERNQKRAEMLAERLSKTIVFCADASDQAFLFEEHIENIDAFIALTSDDEANIKASLLAKRLGTKKAIALIQRIAYLHLVQGRYDRYCHFTRNRRLFRHC